MPHQLKHAVLIVVLMVIGSALACSLSASDETTLEQEAELQAVYEHYREVVSAAHETHDTQYLDEVVTGEWLISMTEHAELPGQRSPGFHGDAEIIEFTVTYYGYTIAAVEVREKWSKIVRDSEMWREERITCEFYRESYSSDWKVSYFDEYDYVDNPEMYMTAAAQPTPTPY